MERAKLLAQEEVNYANLFLATHLIEKRSKELVTHAQQANLVVTARSMTRQS